MIPPSCLPKSEPALRLTQSAFGVVLLRKVRRPVPMRFDLSDLRLFLNVVEAGSITHGAEHMHLAIAAASTRIRNMEAALGTPLLHRERQGVQPTPAGRTLVHHARLLLQQAERMHGELAQYAEGIKGQVRLLSNTNALTEFLPEPLSDFLASHPQVNIDLEERLSDEIVAAVADGTADIGIVAATVEVAGLETLPFRTDRFVLVVAPKHPLATVEHIAFAEVLDFDFVGLDRTSALQRFLSEKAERIGRRLKLRVQLRSFDAVCRLVECNVGIGVVPETTAARNARTMSIHRIALADDWALRKLTICVRRQEDLPIYARELVRPPRLHRQHPLRGAGAAPRDGGSRRRQCGGPAGERPREGRARPGILVWPCRGRPQDRQRPGDGSSAADGGPPLAALRQRG